MPLGYEVTIFEQYGEPGGLMRTNIPSFRLPHTVLNEEIAMITGMGVDLQPQHPGRQHARAARSRRLRCGVRRLGRAQGQGAGAARARGAARPTSTSASPGWSRWPSATSSKIGERVLIIGVGNTAMDCCRTSLRLGAESVKVMARKPRGFFKASEWELEDAEEESVEIVVNRSPKAFVIENGRLTGMLFEQHGVRRSMRAAASPPSASSARSSCRRTT